MATNRYAAIRRVIPKQVALLQQSPEFRDLCAQYYERGLPDWSILSAAHNACLNLFAWNNELSPQEMQSKAFMKKATGFIEDHPIPERLFTVELMEEMLSIQKATVLASWGFEFRTGSMDVGGLERFLRERFPVYEVDLPHKPMFGDPPGDWPNLKD